MADEIETVTHPDHRTTWRVCVGGSELARGYIDDVVDLEKAHVDARDAAIMHLKSNIPSCKDPETLHWTKRQASTAGGTRD